MWFGGYPAYHLLRGIVWCVYVLQIDEPTAALQMSLHPRQIQSESFSLRCHGTAGIAIQVCVACCWIVTAGSSLAWSVVAFGTNVHVIQHWQTESVCITAVQKDLLGGHSTGMAVLRVASLLVA